MLRRAGGQGGDEGRRIGGVGGDVMDRRGMAHPEPHRQQDIARAQQQHPDQKHDPPKPEAAAGEDEGHDRQQRPQHGGERCHRQQPEGAAETQPALAPSQRCGTQGQQRYQAKQHRRPRQPAAPS